MESSSALGALAGMGMFAILVMIVVGVLVSALILSVAYRLIVGHMPSYPRALAAVVVGWVASWVVRLVLHGGVGDLLSWVAQFLVGAWIIKLMLPSNDGSQLSYGKSCLVQLVYMVIFIVLAIVLAVIFGAIFVGLFRH